MEVTKGNKPTKFWQTLTGDPVEFSMENRVFNYTCVVSFAILLYGISFNLYLGIYPYFVILIATISVLSILYYYSRVKKRYQTGIQIYATVAYGLLVSNYFFNSGINGPTMCMFFLVFHLLVAIGKARDYVLWIFLNSSIAIGLLVFEYFNPDFVTDAYRNRTDRFLDTGVTYIAALTFTFAITRYLRKSFDQERTLAEKRANAIQDQNEQIKEKNAQLELLNDEKNKLFSIVSHDLKSPIDSLTGYLEIMSSDLLSEEDRRKIENELLEKTRYASEMLANMLTWARNQMNGVKVTLVNVDMNSVIDESLNAKITIAAKKQVNLKKGNTENAVALCDYEMTRIILRNLVNNAIKFTRENGEITISAECKGEEVVLSVKDTGVGIPLEKQSGIFSLKTKSSYGTNNEKGIGLGLLLCKDFTDYQHGRIWFESEPGVGSTFFVAFPAA